MPTAGSLLTWPNFALQSLKKEQFSRSSSNTSCRVCAALLGSPHPSVSSSSTMTPHSVSYKSQTSLREPLLHLTGLVSPPWSAGYHSSCWVAEDRALPPEMPACHHHHHLFHPAASLPAEPSKFPLLDELHSAELAKHILGLYPQPEHES